MRNTAANDGPAKLRRRRMDMGLSQAELGLAIGFTEGSSVAQYEQRVRPFIFPRLLMASRITGIPVWELAWPDQRKTLVQLAAAVPEFARVSL